MWASSSPRRAPAAERNEMFIQSFVDVMHPFGQVLHDVSMSSVAKLSFCAGPQKDALCGDRIYTEGKHRPLCSAQRGVLVGSSLTGGPSSPLENRQIVGCSMLPRVSEFRANSLIFAPLYPPKDRDEHAPTPKQACRPMPFQGATRTSHSIEPLMILEEILVD
jgi:hypothetical protein